MFRFSSPQQIIEISGVKLGGQPGELPTVMIGSIFFEGHSIVEDPKNGIFDERKAEELVNSALELSEETGNPTIIDVVGESSEALIRYIDFISEICDAPFLVDGTTASIRADATKYVGEVGLQERAIYNSISEHLTDEERKAIRESRMSSAVILAVNSRNPMVSGRIEMAERLIREAEELGIKNILVDTGVLDIPDVGIASRTIFEVKERFGLPSGCAPANTIDMWTRLKERGKDIFRVCDAFGSAMTPLFGADFVMYGPIGRAKYIYPAVSFADAIIAYTMRHEGVRPRTREHPLFRIF
ncbi:MAG: tetrahydromethanopterin S-methyltransferase subunit [Archaeoglobi archaeon]|nr:tetrahydromethanopterin S-methyltransferase subunit [Archaeoglobi archaeon]MDK2781360.1 tetrahydromethanopterin S-methyltransferase subunit [Archaeoglobi archaeon]